MRIDQYIVEKGLAPSRAKAQELISENKVKLIINGNELPIKKASYKINEDHPPEIKIEKNEILRFVSRAGLKLQGALDELSIDVDGFMALDIGQSTGGFTDCLIQNKAKVVVGVDVGRDQIHSSLKGSDSIQIFEGLNARALFDDTRMMKFQGRFDLVVMDVSFVSMTKMLGSIRAALKPGGMLLSLVKPQFELQKKSLDKNGVVKSLADYQVVESKVKSALEDAGFKTLSYIKSTISGGDGNKEFFVLAKS